MSIEITCDKYFCDMPTKDAGQCSPTWCTHGYNFIMCEKCYDGMIREIEE